MILRAFAFPLLATTIFVVLPLTACSKRGTDAEVMATVGKRKITRGDLKLRTKEQKLENPASVLTDEIIYHQLIRANTYAELMAQNGRPVDDKILDSERQRIERESLMPEKLKEIRAIFPTNEDFLHAYVLPVYVNRVLYFDLYVNGSQFHQAELARLNQFRAEVVEAIPTQGGDAGFRALTLERGLQYSEVIATRANLRPANLPEGLRKHSNRMPPNDPKIPANVQKAALGTDPKSASDSERLVDELLTKLAPGGFTPVVEWQSQFTLFRLQAKKPGDARGEYRLQAATINKAPFDKWVAGEARKLEIKCLVAEKACDQAIARLREQ